MSLTTFEQVDHSNDFTKQQKRTTTATTRKSFHQSWSPLRIAFILILTLSSSSSSTTNSANAFMNISPVVHRVKGIWQTVGKRPKQQQQKLPDYLPLQSSTTTSSPSEAADLVSRGGGDSDGELGTGTATIPNEVFNLVKSIAGSGVLSLSAGIAAFGNAPSALIPAIGLIGIMGAISAYTFSLIGRLCSSTKTDSYADAWDATVGSKWSPLVAFSCFIDCLNGVLCYSMILADTFTSLARGSGLISSVTRTQSLLGITLFVLLPLCLLKNLSSLAPFSLVGIVGMFYTTLAMAFRYFGKFYAEGGKFAAAATTAAAPLFGNKGAMSVWDPKSLILMCMLSNAFIAHFNAPKFYKELKNNTLPRFNQVVGWSFGASILLFSTIASMGFLTFGSASNGYILNNYANTDFLMSLSRVAIAISITCSYPLIFVGARDGLLDLFKIKKRSDGLLNQMTLGILGVTTALAAYLTDLGLVASVGGATFGTALVFIYPAIMFLKHQEKQKATSTATPTKVNWRVKVETWSARCIAVLGVLMGIIGTIMALKGEDV